MSEFKPGQKVIYKAMKTVIEDGHFKRIPEPRPVKVMGVIGNWAMVRSSIFRGAAPYCVPVKELTTPPEERTV